MLNGYAKWEIADDAPMPGAANHKTDSPMTTLAR